MDPTDLTVTYGKTIERKNNNLEKYTLTFNLS